MPPMRSRPRLALQPIPTPKMALPRRWSASFSVREARNDASTRVHGDTLQSNGAGHPRGPMDDLGGVGCREPGSDLVVGGLNTEDTLRSAGFRRIPRPFPLAESFLVLGR